MSRPRASSNTIQEYARPRALSGGTMEYESSPTSSEEAIVPTKKRKPKFKTIRNNKYWTNEIELCVKHILNQVQGYLWIYTHMHNHTRQWATILNLITGILGLIIGTSGVASIQIDANWIKILTSIIGFIIGFAAVLNNTWKFDETQKILLQTQIELSNLESNILFQLTLPKSNRIDGREYMRQKLIELENIKANAPPISSGTKKIYQKKFSNGIFHSDVFVTKIASLEEITSAI